MNKSYSELILIPSFEERFKYLQISAHVGEETFGWNRYLNQRFYRSCEWRRFRNKVIIRDNGHDLAMPDDIFSIPGRIYIHHINPITKDDIVNGTNLFDLENVVCVSFNTHQAIHYGAYSKLFDNMSERHAGDTTLW